jgi:hypothetical protein
MARIPVVSRLAGEIEQELPLRLAGGFERTVVKKA